MTATLHQLGAGCDAGLYYVQRAGDLAVQEVVPGRVWNLSQ